MSRKILVSAGFGAGWSSWNSGGVAKYMLEYQPIIDFLEKGGKFTHDDCNGDYLPGGGIDDSRIHPLLKQLQKECQEKFGESYVCVLGADDLEVREVSGRIRIHEYDGSESVEEEGEFSGWM